MSRPILTTPVVKVVNTLRALAPWYASHATLLQTELGSGFAGDKQAQTLAEQLAQADELLARESKEDRGVTDTRNAAIEELRLLYRGIFSSVRRRARNKIVNPRVIDDFKIGQPSRVYTTPHAQTFLGKLSNAILLHRDALSQDSDRTKSWLDQLDALKTKFENIVEDKSKEALETASARNKRNELREQAIALIEDLELAAESMLAEDGKSYDELQVLFATQNPDSILRSSGTEEVVNEVTPTDDPADPTGDQAPTS